MHSRARSSSHSYTQQNDVIDAVTRGLSSEAPHPSFSFVADAAAMVLGSHVWSDLFIAGNFERVGR